MTERFRIARSPNITTPHNHKTWGQLEAQIGVGGASFEELIAICEGHDHPSGSLGFVKYCLKNEWLVLVDDSTAASNLSKRPRDTSVSQGVNVLDTGVYIAFPTSETMKPIYGGSKTKVNSSHTKVGITTDSFESRGSGYAKTFDDEVTFTPLASVPANRLKALEDKIIAAVVLRFHRVGSALEWFDTDDREAITEIVLGVIHDDGA